MKKYIKFDCDNRESFNNCLFCHKIKRCNANSKHHPFDLDDVVYYEFLDDELSCCPYCGAKAKLIHQMENDIWHYEIECEHKNKCLLSHCKVIPKMRDKKVLVKMWNKRYKA